MLKITISIIVEGHSSNQKGLTYKSDCFSILHLPVKYTLDLKIETFQS